MTALDEALRRDSLTLADIAYRYGGPIDMTAAALLNVLMEHAVTLQTFAGPMLVLPADHELLDRRGRHEMPKPGMKKGACAARSAWVTPW